MNVLVIGGGGREHALAWKLHKSPSVKSLHATPGNPGIARIARCHDLSAHSALDYVNLAEHLSIDLTVVGPEAPLVSGIADQFRSRGLAIVGPDAANAALEGSKAYSKQFMQKVGIPTARFEITTNASEAREALRHFQFPVVLKTDGLAAGKGVVIAQTKPEAINAFASLAFPVVIEEYLAGEEVSFIVLADGTSALPLEPSQDHKRIFDGDEGPNTGGMGAYSASFILSPRQRSHILDTIIEPVIRATRFTGFLYAGLMMTPDGPRVLEFNVRLGDPETQPLMMRLESDWAETLMASTRGALNKVRLDWSPDPATCVVLASGGYPGAFETGKSINGVDGTASPGAVVFHAGTKRSGAQLLTSGGRVLGVAATGTNLAESIQRAYTAVDQIHFDGMHYRKDIGKKALQRYNETEMGT